MKTRNGKHAPNKTAIKAYFTKWRKAVINVTAAISDVPTPTRRRRAGKGEA